MKYRYSIVIAVLIVVSSLPALTLAELIPDEICGDGIDNKQTYVRNKYECPAGWVPAKTLKGCDLLCPQPDEDWDGYKDIAHCDPVKEKCDCAPNDKFVYPGSGATSVGCPSGQSHYCKDDGSFTSCESFVCPVGYKCYFFDPVAGNNSSNDGSISKPWKDLAKISYWYYTITPPFPVHTPVNGDMFILRGGTYSSDYNLGYGSRTFQCRNSSAGSVEKPVVITSFPGERAEIVPSTVFANAQKSTMMFEGCDYWTVRNITIRNGLGIGISFDSGAKPSDNIVMQNLIITSPSAQGDNLGCIGSFGTHNARIENNIAYDCYKSALANPNVENNSILIDFRSNNLNLLYNTFFYTKYITERTAGGVTGVGIKQKHANYDSSILMSGNVVFNAGMGGVALAGGNWTISKHLNYRTSSSITHKDLGGTSFAAGEITGGFLTIEDSTFVKSGSFNYSPVQRYDLTTGAYLADDCSAPYSIAKWRMRNNLIVSDRANDNSENREFYYHIYGPDHFYDLSRFVFANNTWYNSSATPTFGIQESNNGNTSCSGRGVLGSAYSWSAWQSQGFDTSASGSLTSNPELDVYLRANASGHVNKGRLKIGDALTIEPPSGLSGRIIK